MLWEESESTARYCSYAAAAFAVFAGIVCVAGTLLTGDWMYVVAYAVMLMGGIGFILVWIVSVGGMVAASMGFAKAVAAFFALFRRKPSGLA